MTRYVVAAIVVAALFVVLAVQNAASVTTHILAWQVDAPLYAVALVSALMGAAVAEGLGTTWRHRRHRRNRERQELIDLRDERIGNLTDDEARAAGPTR